MAAGGEIVEIEPVADHFEEAQFFLLEPEIDRRHFDGQRIGSVVQPLGHGLQHHFEHLVEIGRVLDQIDRRGGGLAELAAVELSNTGRRGHQPA